MNMRLNKLLMFVALFLGLSISAFADVTEVDMNNDGNIDKWITWSDTGDLLSQKSLNSDGSYAEVTFSVLNKKENETVYTQLNKDGSADTDQSTIVYVKDKSIYMIKNAHPSYGLSTYYLVNNTPVSVELMKPGAGKVFSKTFFVNNAVKLTVRDNDGDGVFEDVIAK